MAETTLETALVALAAVLTGPPGSAPLQRNVDVPSTVDLTGLLILRDGNPGEPETILSPLRYSYEHAAELEIYVQSSPSSARAATLPALLAGLAAGWAPRRGRWGAPSSS